MQGIYTLNPVDLNTSCHFYLSDDRNIYHKKDFGSVFQQSV
ncbi:hypothetical protein HY638_02435, partial [Candidatus Woesearchaeota archaeon]|nr:hypothetical protein [Candidatus Woesearchaeota archaeon]